MKKTLLFIISFFILSCTTLKKVKSTDTSNNKFVETELVKNKDTKTEVIEKIEKSEAIEKTNTISLKTSDSLVNAKINEALKNFSYRDKSGRNSVSARYDEKTMRLILEAFISSSNNKSKEESFKQEDSTKETKTTKEEIKEVIDSYIKKIVVPWWVYVLLIFMFRKSIVSIISFFAPQVRGIKSINDLLTPPK